MKRGRGTFALCQLPQYLLIRDLRRNIELSRILQRVVEIGMRGGWAEFEGTPLQIPRIQLASRTINTNTNADDTNIPQ